MPTLSDIATYAALYKPAKSKAAAWSALQAVIVGDGTVEQFAALYRYFEPKATSAQLADDDFAWCAAAVETDGVRDYLEYAYCDGRGNLIATDGKRLHVATFDGAEGYYSPHGQVLEGAMNKWTFPEWTRLVPDETGRLHWYACLSEVFAVKGDSGELREAYELADGTLVDRTLWDAAVAGRETAVYCAAQPGEIILLPDLGGGRYALVVGLNPDKVRKV